MLYRAVIEVKVPSLNEYIEACRRNKYAAANMKKYTEAEIAPYLMRLPTFGKPVFIHFLWIERDHRRDCDNVAAGKKFILDAMVKAGKLKDDGRKYVLGFTDDFECGNRTMCIMDVEVDE